MQTIIDVSVATVAWTVTVFKFNAVRREWRGNRDRRVLTSWAFALFFSLCMTFQVDAVYVTVDALTGVNNLSWLLAYLCLTLAIYLVCTGCCTAMKVDPPPWALPYLVVTAGLLVIIFPVGIATAPEWADHTVPRSAPEFLFMDLMYVYAIVMGVIPTLAFARFQRNEGTLPTRLRTSGILLAAILAITFFVAKFTVSLFSFLTPWLPPMRYLTVLTRLLMAASGLLWTMAFAPNSLYLALARPFSFWEKVLTLRDLKQLQTRLNRLCPPVVPDQPTWRDQLRNLDFHIYRTMIGILDGRKMLAGHLEQGSQGPRKHLRTGAFPELRRRAPLLRWDAQATEEAIRLHWALQSAPELQDFEGLVTVYRDLSRQLEVRAR